MVKPLRRGFFDTLTGRFVSRSLVLFVILGVFLSWMLCWYMEGALDETAAAFLERAADDLRRCVSDGGGVGGGEDPLDVWLRRWGAGGCLVAGPGGVERCRVDLLVDEDWFRELCMEKIKAGGECSFRGNRRPSFVPGTVVEGPVPHLSGRTIRYMLVTVPLERPGAGSGERTAFFLYPYEPVAWRVTVLRVIVVVMIAYALFLLLVALGVIVKEAEEEIERSREILTARNIELERTRRHLFHANKLAALGELSAAVAHEVKNPLASMGMGLELALSLCGGADAKLRETLERVAREVDRLSSVVKNLLGVARRSSDERAEVDLNKVVERVLMLFSRSMKEKGIRLEKRLCAALPPVRANEGEVEQVLLNLLTNSFQAVEGDGMICVATGFDEREVFVEVQDDAGGIPEDILERVFEPFFTAREDGTGLGLSISREIAERHGGRLELENHGEGVRACFILPRGDVASGGRA